MTNDPRREGRGPKEIGKSVGTSVRVTDTGLPAQRTYSHAEKLAVHADARARLAAEDMLDGERLGDPLSGEEMAEAAFQAWEAGDRFEEQSVETPFPSGPRDYGLPENQTELESARAPKRFTPVAIDDVEIAAEPAWAIHRLLPARGLACVVGEPKSRKSFLITDALFQVARGVPYAGRSTLQGPVIYLTGEGIGGFRRRLVAMRRHYGVEGQGVPFFMVENVPDLGSEKTNLQQFFAELDEFIAENQLPPPRAIALDTLARCMGTGDENTARDMGRFTDRCGQIERRYGCVVVAVHHFGKDKSKGGRGSNALNGATDVTWQVEKFEAHSRVRVDEMKDGPDGASWTFRLIPVEISATSATPIEGSETTTCCVELLDEPAQMQQSATKRIREPTGVDGDLLKVVRRAIQESGELGIAGPGAPGGARAIPVEVLKTYCSSMAWQQDKEAKAFRAVLSRSLSNLRSKDFIGRDQTTVWLART